MNQLFSELNLVLKLIKFENLKRLLTKDQSENIKVLNSNYCMSMIQFIIDYYTTTTNTVDDSRVNSHISLP